MTGEGQPLLDASPVPADLAACPWIDFDRQLPATSVPAIAAGDGPGLDSVLERLFRDTGQRAAIVLRAGAAGLFPIATEPWLAWLPLDFLDRMNGPRLKPLPVSIGRYSYRTGFVARRSAEDLASFLALEDTVRDVALDRSRRPQG